MIIIILIIFIIIFIGALDGAIYVKWDRLQPVFRLMGSMKTTVY